MPEMLAKLIVLTCVLLHFHPGCSFRSQNHASVRFVPYSNFQNKHLGFLLVGFDPRRHPVSLADGSSSARTATRKNTIENDIERNLIEAKLNEWRELKAMGLLEKISGGSIDEDEMEKVEQAADAIRRRQLQQTATGSSEIPNDAHAGSVSQEDPTISSTKLSVRVGSIKSKLLAKRRRTDSVELIEDDQPTGNAELDDAVRHNSMDLDEPFNSNTDERREMLSPSLGEISMDIDDGKVRSTENIRRSIARAIESASSVADNGSGFQKTADSGFISKKLVSDMREKLTVARQSSINVRAINCFNLLMEVISKAALDLPLMQDIVIALSKVRDPSASKYLVRAVTEYFSIAESSSSGSSGGNVVSGPADPSAAVAAADISGFAKALMMSCYTNSMFLGDKSVKEVENILASERNLVNEKDLVVGRICFEVIKGSHSAAAAPCPGPGPSQAVGFDAQQTYRMPPDALQVLLNPLYNTMTRHYPSINELNQLIRVLGRYEYTDAVFALFSRMRAVKNYPNSESLEFLANALVLSVSKGVKATNMRELPAPDSAIPEIVFVGRSNVGKSSLVNFLLNRKALASTSATPGHTQHFHFFTMNQQQQQRPISVEEREEVVAGEEEGEELSPSTAVGEGRNQRAAPMFRFVDVPGVGYAETVDASKQQSWRNLLERYFIRRSPLRLVCHLVDSRIKLAPADVEMIGTILRAHSERGANGELPFRYVIVLTKTDKIKRSQIAKTIADTRAAVQNIVEQQTSAQDTSVRTAVRMGIHEKEENHSELSNGKGIRRTSDADRKVKTKRDKNMVESGRIASEFVSGGTATTTTSSLFSGVEIVTTSSVSRDGADDLWRLIQEAIQRQ